MLYIASVSLLNEMIHLDIILRHVISHERSRLTYIY